MPLVPGQTAEVQRVVTHALAADVLGNAAVDMRHLAATPVGMTVRAKAVLRETDGCRCLLDVEAWEEVEKIAEGRHERYVVSNLARFLARAS